MLYSRDVHPFMMEGALIVRLRNVDKQTTRHGKITTRGRLPVQTSAGVPPRQVTSWHSRGQREKAKLALAKCGGDGAKVSASKEARQRQKY